MTVNQAAAGGAAPAPYQPPQVGRWAKPLGRRTFLSGALATAAAGCLSWRPPLDLWPSALELAADYYTAAGQQLAIAPLPYVDVQMNTRTCINMRRDADGPDMDLVAGEAEIRVHPGASGTIAVRAGPGLVLTRAAAFNIRYTAPQVVLTCLQGEVQVQAAGQRQTLPAGLQLVYGAQGAQPAVAVDPARAIAWRTGMLSFAGEPLAEAVDEINRYRAGRIVVFGQEAGRRPVRMRLAVRDVESHAVALLMRATGLQATELPGGLVVLS